MHARSLAVLALATLMLAPGSLAAWSIKGAAEPDTPYDLDPAHMQLVPDIDPFGPPMVYFNGFGGVGGAATTTLNPNLAGLGTAFHPVPFVPIAMFGIWRDCNGDGFVGMGDQGMLEYPTQALIRADICPPSIPGVPAWRTHNDGQWVVEFMPIGYDDITSPQDENPLNVNDTSARVWADWGLPGDAPGLSCPTVPMPRGSFRSTGGMLRLVDCFTGFRGTQTLSTIAVAAGQPGIGFQDASPDRPDQSRSPLNQPNPWGNAADEPIVRAFDCSQETPVAINDPTLGGLGAISDENGNILTLIVRPPRVGADPGGSPGGTVNETEAGLTDCDRSDDGEIIDLDGKQAGSDGDLPYALEGGSDASSSFALRSRTDHVFTFEEGARGGDAITSILGERAREHLGIGIATLTGFWVGTGGGSLGRNPFVDREQLTVEPVTHITYYATMSEDLIILHGLRLPGGLSLTPYGLAACGNGVAQCDPSLWWRDTAGNDIMPRDARLGAAPNDPTVPLQIPETEIGVRIGQLYRMRDIDCIDESFNKARAQGVHWGAATDTSCGRP